MEQATVSLSPHIHSPLDTRRIMLDVLIALAPAGIVSIIFYGWHAALLMVLGVLSAMLAEALIQRLFKKEITIFDGSAALTGLLVAYNLPSVAPWWLVVLGSVFAIIIVKQVFGGLGHNFLNPAITARAFLLASWPALMTTFSSPLAPDTITSVTPLASLTAPASPGTELLSQFVGPVAGSIGEVSALALVVGGVYLLLRRVIDWRIPLFFFGGILLLSLMAKIDPIRSLFSGGVILGGFFMLTDYVTSPMTSLGRIIYALGAALLVMLIRLFNKAFPEGMTYAIMFMNILTPLIERATRPRVFGEVRSRA